jgi:hypothetical protein
MKKPLLSILPILTSAALAACGSSPAGSGATAGAGGGGRGGANAGGPGGSAGSAAMTVTDAAAPPDGCPKSALAILFNPMYSAFDGVHTFQLPAVVNGIDPAVVAVQWSATDPSMVAFEPDPTTGGVMITMQKAGMVSIIAQAGDLCGIAPLTITSATPDDWMAGSERYNNGVVLNRLPVMRRDAGTDGGADGGIEAKCTDCHGDTASGPFKTVQHTPEQTGGFSDDDLLNIIQNGVVPKGGYFDTMIVSYEVWQQFHKWNVGDSGKGLVVYLRSLTPAAQTGVPNFGGRFDGGVPDGGFPDGGFPDGGSRDGGMPRRDGGIDASAAQ